MKTRSFFTKLFLANLLLIGVIIGIGGFVSYRRLSRTHRQGYEIRQERILTFAQRCMELLWAADDPGTDRFDREAKRLLGNSALRMTVVARDGLVLGHSREDPRDLTVRKVSDRPEVQAALAGEEGRSAQAAPDGEPVRYLARPIRHAGRVVGAVRVGLPVETIEQTRGFMLNSLLWAALASVLAAVVLALLLSWIWYAPLMQITRTARTLAAGDLSKRAVISGSDELAQLATALNEMRDNISSQINLIAAQKQNLVAVVENLREGVIGLDGSGTIVLINPSAVELLAAGAGDVRGKHLQAAVRIAEIVDVYNDATEADKPVSRQVEADIGRRRYVLDVHAARLAEDTTEEVAVLLVVRDISNLVRMATIKAEFVANASHELRTPLATIRAAVDSLGSVEPGEGDELHRLSAILDRHTRRLEEMTNDLLSLHLVESTRHRLRLERIALGTLAAWVRDNFSHRAGEKGVALEVTCGDGQEQLRSDGTLLQLILQNLLDNAIKFTPAGGTVRCEFQADGDRITMRVKDSGRGIPPEIQDRVFERFFQADGSRSGEPKVRGTGLGLAIVKHAAERLRAFIHLDSAVDRGTEVTVTVPREQGG